MKNTNNISPRRSGQRKKKERKAVLNYKKHDLSSFGFNNRVSCNCISRPKEGQQNLTRLDFIRIHINKERRGKIDLKIYIHQLAATSKIIKIAFYTDKTNGWLIITKKLNGTYRKLVVAKMSSTPNYQHQSRRTKSLNIRRVLHVKFKKSPEMQPKFYQTKKTSKYGRSRKLIALDKRWRSNKNCAKRKANVRCRTKSR